MIRFRCEQCDSLLETDASPGCVESCPDCGLQLLVPAPKAPRVFLWKEKWRHGRKEADSSGPPQEADYTPHPRRKPAPSARPHPTRQQAYRKLHTRSLSIRALGWLFAALSVVVLCPCSRTDVPCSQFFAMLSVCGVLLVGGVLLVALGHLLAGVRIAAMSTDGARDRLVPQALTAESGE